METKNAFLAIFLSMAVLFGYQLLFPPPPPSVPVAEQASLPQATTAPTSPILAREEALTVASLPVVQQKSMAPARPARDIKVETSLYTAIIGEDGGTVKSFRLNNYR